MATKKKNTSQKTDQILESFSLFFDTVNTPTLLLSQSGEEIILSNEAFNSLSSYSAEQIRKISLEQLFTLEDEDRVLAMIDILALSSGEVNELDLSLKKRSGKTVGVNVFASSVDLNGQHRIILSIHDVSKLKGLQIEKEKSIREMAHVSKLADIGRLAAGVAHELNNPLMIIQGFAENIDLMCEEEGEIEAEELKWQVSPILKAIDRMARIISQLTRLSRNDKDMKLTHVDLIEVVEDIIGLVSNQFRYNDIEIVKEWKNDHIVKCDPNQVEQIILNIISNAIHALTKLSEKRKITISLRSTGKEEILSIHNNGPAIPQDVQEKILTPFFTTKEIGEGTGLGLSVSYGIMKAHGGDLSFKSKEGQGTTFDLRFPKPSKIKKVVSKTNAIGLVVDDDAMSREVIASKMSRFGYQIIQAESAFTALDVLKANENIAFMFTDIKMPKMDGAKLIQEVRKLNRDILVYAVSGFLSEKLMTHQLSKHGVNGFLTKPLDHDRVSMIVAQIEDELTVRQKVS